MKVKQFYQPLANEYKDDLHWNPNDKSDSVRISLSIIIIFILNAFFKVQILGINSGKTACFHTGWSSGTAAIRANLPINIHKNKYYWEVLIKDKIYGTSMMIGLTTSNARLHSNSYMNLIGEDGSGWVNILNLNIKIYEKFLCCQGLSHKGLLWHNGKWKEYTKPFQENCSTYIGCLFDGKNGTITFYKDGKNLGIAFSGLDTIKENLYPTISSTAAQSQFVLTIARREYLNLQDRCREVIRQNYCLQFKDKWQPFLPERIFSYLNFEQELNEARFKEKYKECKDKRKCVY